MANTKSTTKTIAPAHRAQEKKVAVLDMDTLVSLCKRRGFIFQSSEIYGGFGSTWDYGPLGVELKRNIKDAWWRACVLTREDMVGLDTSILMHPQTWVASGHLEKFADPLIECRNCHMRFKADEIKNDTCPNCGTVGQFTPARQFNLMFKTHVGPVEDDAAVTYLRPETAQGIFVNFLNVLQTSRKKLPFGIAQTGKAFRNEITTGNFIFRVRELEQMEIEYFVRPGEDERWHKYWIEERLNWYKGLGIREENLQLRLHRPDELSHYSKATTDIEYKFPFGWGEIEGIANRTDYDLRRHSEESGKDLSYFDPDTNERFIPYVIEPSAGVERIFLALLADAYHEEVVRGEKRIVLRLSHNLAPVKAAILPLLRNREEIVALAKKIATDLRPHLAVMYDDTAAIGRLYRRQDEIGTPFCITADVQSLEDKAVTIRDRDSMEQIRLPIAEVKGWLLERFSQP